MLTGVRRVTAQADFARLDKILLQTVTAIKDSQQQINSIADDARLEVARLKRELEQVKKRTLAVIDRVDAARREEQQSRLHLMKVSQDLKHYDEDEIRLAYAHARDMQVRLIVYTEQEKELRTKRDELERIYERMLECMPENMKKLHGESNLSDANPGQL